jgi:transcriptional regulator with XRE-family HTH domain
MWTRSSDGNKERRGRGQGRKMQDDLGLEIKRHRERAGMSQRELARRLSISHSAVSQIESGKARPSVSTLYEIITELGMSLDKLFGSPLRQSPRETLVFESTGDARNDRSGSDGQERLQRSNTRVGIDLESGVRWERLTAQADDPVDFLYVIYDVGGSSSEGGRFIRHSGREYGIVLTGTLEVTVGFDTYVLSPGDSICFNSTTPHVLRNIGTEPACGVWCVIGRHDSDGPVVDDARVMLGAARRRASE